MKKEIMLFFAGLCSLILLIGTGMIIGSNIEKEPKIEIVKIATVEPEIDSIIKNLNIKFPHILRAQIKLESGNLTSIRAIRYNNLTGMKVAKARPTTAINKSGYAIYNSIEDCIVDYALWQSQNAFRCKTEQDYFELLGRIYAEDPKYIEKLKQILQ